MGHSPNRPRHGVKRRTRDGSVSVRWCREPDVPAVLSLYQDVLSETYSRKWFDWKYRKNPYSDTLPIVVALQEDDVVGATGFWPLKYASMTDTVSVIQPCDGAVDKENRRQGIYTKIFEFGLDETAMRGARFAFDFPNKRSQQTFEKFGWQPVGSRPEWRLLQRPSVFLGHESREWIDSLMSPLVRTTSIGLRIKSALARTLDPVPMDIVRFDGVPADIFSQLYESSPPAALHAYRDDAFYRWRFENPLVSYHSYVAYEHGEPTVGLILSTSGEGAGQIAQIVDIVPVDCSDPTILEAVFSVAVDESSDAAVIQITSDSIPRRLLERWGFMPDNRIPLSLVTEKTIHGVHSLGNGWTINGLDIRDPTSWELTYIDYDTR